MWENNVGYFIYHPYITAPLLLLALAFVPARSKFNTVFNTLIVGLYVFLLYQKVSWPDYGSYYLGFFYIFLFLAACIKPVIRFKSLPVFSKKYPWRWLVRVFGVFKILGLVFLLLILAMKASDTVEQSPVIDLAFPLKKGTYYITNQHTHWTDQYAYDITELNILGREWSGSFSKPADLEHYNIFRDTVYSPCNGRVSEVVEQYPDHGIGELEEFQVPANKVVIEVGNKSVELLHLLQNSVLVNAGDTVVTGQPVALVGNSGVSRHPHLHTNVYLNNSLLQHPASKPFSIDGKVLSEKCRYSN